MLCEQQPQLDGWEQVRDPRELGRGQQIGIVRVIAEARGIAHSRSELPDGATGSNVAIPLGVATIKSVRETDATACFDALIPRELGEVVQTFPDFDVLPMPEKSPYIRNFKFSTVGLVPLDDGLWVPSAVVRLL
jgi:hypothetical protein